MKSTLITALGVLCVISGVACQQGTGKAPFATEAARNLSYTPFTTSWWTGNDVGSKAELATANARIYAQGLTPDIAAQIRGIYTQAQQSAAQNFVNAFRDVCKIGPGLYYGYQNISAAATVIGTATWASQNAPDLFPFNADAANLGRTPGAPIGGPASG